MMPQHAQHAGNGMTAEIELFEYPGVAGAPVPSWEAFPSVALHASAGTRLERAAEDVQETRLAVREMHAEELRRSFEAGLTRGLAEGRAAERQSFAAIASDQEARRMEEAARL